jgi:hypothetical protein
MAAFKSRSMTFSPFSQWSMRWPNPGLFLTAPHQEQRFEDGKIDQPTTLHSQAISPCKPAACRVWLATTADPNQFNSNRADYPPSQAGQLLVGMNG